MVPQSESPKAELCDTAIRPPRPVWVRIGLCGLPNRVWAMSLMWFSLVLAGTCIVLSLWDRRAASGGVFVFVALWYWVAIRWVDSNGGWHSSERVSKHSTVPKVLAWSGVAVLLALLAVKTLFIDYYRIPQNGMYPGLPAGSVLFTAKRAYSDASSVRRGDIVVFVREENGQRYNYIWRVVALPGERVEASGESLVINGRAVQRQRLREEDGRILFREQIDGISYEVAFSQQSASQLPNVSVTVPADQFFVMGDNRFDARDSRYFGPVSFSSIIGKKL